MTLHDFEVYRFSSTSLHMVCLRRFRPQAKTSESPKIPKISAKAMAALLRDAQTPEFPKNPMAKCSG